MKLMFSIFYFLLSLTGVCQIFEIYNNDTINRIDSLGKKQGKWIVFGKHRPKACYKENQKIEEGKYINNRKAGAWVEYFCNGNKRNVIVFKEGRPGGIATLYFENGVVSETGFWKNNRWIGKHRQYDTLGFLWQETEYDSLGKRIGGMKMQFLNNASEPYKPGIYQPVKNEPKIILNGKHTLYNQKKQITKDGIFKDNRFMDGKAYIYDDDGNVIRVAIYKEGKYVGDEPLPN